jgi:5,5'-dehydrodivanillate O-demethylase
MLTAEQNERVTQVRSGTPMGELMRRYWQPIAAEMELEENTTKEVRLLGEDLVLYKDRSGKLGLIDRFCAHRRVNLAYGIPEDHGLRCMYHGWLYDETGQCIEQPFEETVRPESRFKDKIKVNGYRAEALGGMIFAYMGPEPAPLLPRWDAFLWDNVVREITLVVLPSNWLQCVENSLDPVHTEWLHSRLSEYIKELKGEALTAFPASANARHKRIGFDVYRWGVLKRRLVGDETEESDDWARGHPLIFPNLLCVGSREVNRLMQYRVPVDDTHTLQASLYVHRVPEGFKAPTQTSIPYRYVDVYDEDGRLFWERNVDQDKLGMVAQGPSMDRTLERLGETDAGLIMYRKLLEEQMDIVLDGGEPMALIRDPAENEFIDLATERVYQGMGNNSVVMQHIPMENGDNPALDLIEDTLKSWRIHLGIEEPAK